MGDCASIDSVRTAFELAVFVGVVAAVVDVDKTNAAMSTRLRYINQAATAHSTASAHHAHAQACVCLGKYSAKQYEQNNNQQRIFVFKEEKFSHLIVTKAVSFIPKFPLTISRSLGLILPARTSTQRSVSIPLLILVLIAVVSLMSFITQNSD